eukprot:TRINITY_DN14423_c0_g1_i2.p2 TRINITY_DN14423_c0_g1~~TRINITY_DN14423_c0_g1_i2.p2  ORF type:complete len:123 (+),score=30.47 TRINITY_DN14423_c0_g1_i2:64-432(+)
MCIRDRYQRRVHGYAVKFNASCEKLERSVDAKESDDKIKTNYLEMLSEAKILKQDIQQLSNINARVEKIDQYISAIRQSIKRPWKAPHTKASPKASNKINVARSSKRAKERKDELYILCILC